MRRDSILGLPVVALLLATGPAVAQDVPGMAAPVSPVKPGELKKWRALAEKGNPVAQYKLGFFYATGQGVPRDHAEAVRWFLKSAQQGYATAQNDLGVMYDNGLGVKRNHVEAAKWFLKAAEQKNPKALTNLGLMYMQGRGVPEDYGEAVKWYRKASELGYARAQYNLGYMYMKGYGVPQNYNEAVRWYRKAANQGYARAEHSLAFMYRYGRGVPPDYDRAVGLFRKAALQGFEDSVKWLRVSASQGNAGAQYSLGVLYRRGRGVAQDYDEALRWFAESGRQGYAPAIDAEARLLATAKDGEFRNGKKAVVLASKAVKARRSVEALDTLAAAYAEVGRFSAAVQMQLQVLEMLRTQGASPSRVKPYEVRLALYKEKKPYRE